mmetsp:Transcript_25754/g.28455  ORF Transcript_25754/g.28455 Transcript_25754/m.28455 type:complete len:232 (-) Transcript_25754:216-911(-)|eukprot:CAMPEP_0194130466 /NCGR_PEP_ID=MMETSP0152-20130528/1508_1 /TAXON_ID=1049557 /ORGANISM="Thalassiothrix antarctica, Strain L6-D1" /LENGTH=231 /DNA_ID=CAMNT_0038825001 /DNA_START=68 /DNA_END=763 /DNA_ORIENTATION=+
MDESERSERSCESVDLETPSIPRTTLETGILSQKRLDRRNLFFRMQADDHEDDMLPNRSLLLRSQRNVFGDSDDESLGEDNNGKSGDEKPSIHSNLAESVASNTSDDDAEQCSKLALEQSTQSSERSDSGRTRSIRERVNVTIRKSCMMKCLPNLIIENLESPLEDGKWKDAEKKFLHQRELSMMLENDDLEKEMPPALPKWFAIFLAILLLLMFILVGINLDGLLDSVLK